MVQRFAAGARGLDKNPQVGTDLPLAYKIIQRKGANAGPKDIVTVFVRSH
jgi:hypothetical protein